MNNLNTNIQEDAKQDWMNLVKRHKKRQKGLPALSTLNTDAGNVEHNVNMFNKLNTPLSSVNVNPVNGTNISSSESGSLGESVDKASDSRLDEVVELTYENIPIEIVIQRGLSSGYHDSVFGNWLPSDNETTEMLVDWTYQTDKRSVVEVLQDIDEVQTRFNFDLVNEETYISKILDNFEELLHEYMGAVLKHFKNLAISDAEENYKYEFDYPEDTTYEESLQSSNIEPIDDKFDMSMRSLL